MPNRNHLTNSKNGSHSPDVLVVEGPAGNGRTHELKRRLKSHAEAGARTFYLSCAFDLGGPWAGVTELFCTLIREIRQDRPDLIERHGFELVYLLPVLRRTISVSNPNLTDLAPSAERTRNYPADRAVRNIHGLIDLLDEWKMSTAPSTPWVIACDAFDEAGSMGALFFRELIRRRGCRLHLHLMAGVSPGQGQQALDSFDPSLSRALLTLRLKPANPQPADPNHMEKFALALERRIGDDELQRQASLPRLVHLWKQAGNREQMLHYGFLALETYNTQGLYADAIRYGEGLLDLAASERPDDDELRWLIFNKLLMSHLGLENLDESLRLAIEVGLPLAEPDAARRNQLFYLLGIFYARFQKPRDFEKGEAYLERSLAAIAESNLSEGERHFRFVFNRNGLAMIRNFQRRPDEAIELCRNGFAYLNEHLDPDHHRLHRSILLYNIAQVYAATGAYDEACRYYSAVIELDPNYSEYYNERANVLLQLDRLEEAEADYRRAVELSPPYFEVFTNLGQCYRRMGEMAKAIEHYSRALDLQPRQVLALLGRAKAKEELGRREDAIADYTAALDQDPSLWEALASRGVLFYESGRLDDSLADFDAAIALKPHVAELRENRAIVAADLEKPCAMAQAVS